MKYNDTLVANPDSSHLCSFIKTTTALDSGRTVSSWTYFDGRGATVRQFGALTSQGHVGVTDIDYDEMGRVKRTSNPYYASGATAPINPSGKWTTVTYDKLGRAIEIELPDLTKIQSSYNGTTTTVTNQALRQRRQLTDALGRVIRVDEPDANGNLDSGGVPVQPTNYEYDSLDNLTKVTQTQGSITQERLFKYDSLSRLTHERQVEAVATLNDAGVKVGSGGLWTGVYVYDSATGLLKEGYDARGVKTTFIYDNLYRVSQVSFTGETNNVTPNVTYYYDQASSGYFNNGRLTKVETASTSSAPTTSQVFDYDKMGRVAKQQQTIGANGTIAAQTYTLEYGYNLAGQLISEKYPSGRRVAYTVDEAGRLSNVFGGGRTYLSNLSYAGHGGLLAMTYGNGATESFSYNDRLQLTQQSLVKNSSVIQQYEYGYGVVNLNDGTVDTSKNTGQLARVDGFIGGSVSSPTKQWQQRFSYDSIGRLERAKEVRGDNSQLVWESKFSYDRFGNRYRKVSENPNSLPFVAVEESDVDKATNRISTNTTYDEAGNTTTDSKFRNRQYRYDANGRMVWTQPTSSGTESKAVYDALGQRVATQVNGNWRYVVYDIEGKMVAEYGQASTTTDKIRYIQLDRQGSTRAILNQSATVLARFDYQPFGEDIGAGVGMRTTSQSYGGVDSSRQRYALTERDEATGLDHTWWRKYENTAGRWTNPDPYNGSMSVNGPQSFNRYSYVRNDPINKIDPSGLDPRTIWWHRNDEWFRQHGFDASVPSAYILSSPYYNPRATWFIGPFFSQISEWHTDVWYWVVYWHSNGGFTVTVPSRTPERQREWDECIKEHKEAHKKALRNINIDLDYGKYEALLAGAGAVVGAVIGVFVAIGTGGIGSPAVVIGWGLGGAVTLGIAGYLIGRAQTKISAEKDLVKATADLNDAIQFCNEKHPADTTKEIKLFPSLYDFLFP